MAFPNRKFAQNTKGKYYVDDQCIGCALCATWAPAHFRENLAGDTPVDSAYVWHQPRTEKETRRCREALGNCPMMAIGDDGMTPGTHS